MPVKLDTLRPGTPAEAGMAPAHIAQIRRAAGSWIERGDVQALVLLAARRGAIALHEAWGRQTPDGDSPPARLDAIFPLASITKVITATAVMILVEEGLVGLNRSVHEYIPEFAGENKDQVMVHHLLTHTAGWDGEALDDQVLEQLGDDLFCRRGSIEPALDFVYSASLHAVPGKAMWYSDWHFELLGEIVRRCSGQPLEQFVQERIFDPLGMVDSFLVVPDAVKQRVVRRPAAAGADYHTAEFQETPWASAGAYSTARDMAVFGQMYLNQGSYGGERVLGPASVQAMTRDQIPGLGARLVDEHFPEASWGYGWSVHGHKRGMCGGLYSSRAFEHWGAGGVYVWVDPVSDVVGVYCSVNPFPAGEPHRLRRFRNDLFSDMVTAAVMNCSASDVVYP